MGKITRSFDPNCSDGYPGGYANDLALIAPVPEVQFESNRRFVWSQDPKTLFFNKLLRLHSPLRVPVIGGRAFPAVWGASIGQAILKKTRKTFIEDLLGKEPETAGLEKQFSRAFLWRTHGFFSSLRGWSGCPVTSEGEAKDEDLVVGFQAFEFPRLAVWGATDSEMVDRFDETRVKELAAMVGYPFYGI